MESILNASETLIKFKKSIESFQVKVVNNHSSNGYIHGDDLSFVLNANIIFEAEEILERIRKIEQESGVKFTLLD
ncbi:hypothetical protein VCHA53O466_50255 [Vibrio chagasii]|nr:hypothetical protein VCHA53O466_50255 [Vibrio chagasii]